MDKYMDIRDAKKITTAEEAEDFAKEWQNWVSDQDLSMGELVDWQAVFDVMADKFGLREVFEENGIPC